MKDPKAVCIAVSAPKGYKGNAYPELMPTWELVKDYKDGKINEQEYEKRYFDLLKSRKITVDKIVNDLEDESILLCWEAPNKFCHRNLIANWLKAAGTEVEEI